MKRSLSLTLLVICLLVLGITGCDIIEKLKGDSKSSVPPALPDLQFVQPVVDYFDIEFTEQSLEDTSGYELASLLVKSEFNPFVQNIFEYMPFLEGINQSEPELNNGEWEWSYNHNHQSQNYDIRVISKRVEDTEVRDTWTLYISTTLGEVLDNYRFMELSSVVNRTGRGWWIIYPLEFKNADTTNSWVPNFSIDWSIYDEGSKEISYMFNTPFTNELKAASYFNNDNYKDAINFNNRIDMHIQNIQLESKRFTIVWNNTKEGSIFLNYDTDPGMGGAEIEKTLCWDENLNDTECQF